MPSIVLAGKGKSLHLVAGIFFASCFTMFNYPSKISRIAGSVLLFFVWGCNQPHRSAEPVNERIMPTARHDSIPARIDTVDNSMPSIDTIYAGEGDTSILVKNSEIFIRGHIIANKVRPKYTIPAKKRQTVTAILRPVTNRGNVRINQLQLPDGTFDGPFGDSASYTLKRDGNISFIIGENLMTGDPYTGDFILRISIK